jgi:vacuolar-type H+-ATPase subunit H
LEERLRSETPKSGIVLGERIGILLREAEDAAADTVTRAETEAARIRTAADERAAEAEEIVRSANARANEQARRTEAAARAEAAEILAEAETRATARTRQIEQWAEQVISHTRAEEARMLNQQQQTREAFDVELKGLDKQRCAARRTLMELRDALGRALTITDPPAGADAGPETAAANEIAAESEPAIDLSTGSPGSTGSDNGTAPENRAFSMLYGMAESSTGSSSEIESDAEGHSDASVAADRAGDTGGIEVRYSDVDDFEEKLEAWVNDGGEDDRRS